MRILSYRFMKKLDNYFFGSEIVPRNNFKEYLRRFEEYKRLSLSSPMNYILLVIFSIGLITIVLLNDYRNAMIAGVPLFLAVIEAIFIWPILKKRKQVVEEVEDDIDLSTDYIDFQRRVKNLHHAAYRYSYLEVASRYIYAAIIIVVVYLTMKICNINSFPYIIFYTCISLSLFKALREIFSFEERINEFNKVKVKISNSINSRE